MVKLGVIGVGARIRGVVYDALRDLDPDVHIAAFIDPDEAGARTRLADDDRETAICYSSVDEMVRKEQLDGLAIGTRCNLHTEYAIQAAKYDLPLFLEKPISVSMEQAVALEEAFVNSRCQAVVSFPLRVSTLCVLAREYLADGAVGNLEHIMATNYVPYGTIYFDHVGYRNYAITQGLYLQKATHDFDYMSCLMDAPITRIAAMASHGRVFGGNKPAGLHCSQCDEAETCLESSKNRRLNGAGGDTGDHMCPFGIDVGTPETGMNEDHSSALVEFANGAQGVYTQVFFTRRDAARRGATISGYQGTIDFDWYTNQMRYVRHHRPFTDTTKAGEGMGHFGGDTALARNFLDIIAGRRTTSDTSIETGLASVYTCLAAKESAATGQFVQVRQVGQVAAGK